MVAGDILSVLGRLSWMYLLFEWRGDRGKTGKILAAAGTLFCAVYAVGVVKLGAENSALPFFLLLMAGLLLIWCSACYRDMRFWFTVFSVHTLGYCAEAFSGAVMTAVKTAAVTGNIATAVPAMGGVTAAGEVLTVCLYAAGIYLFYRLGPEYRSAMRSVNPHWGFLTLLPLCFYLPMLIASGGSRAILVGQEQPAKAAAVFATALAVYVLMGQMFGWMLRFYNAREKNREMEQALSFQKNYYQLAYQDSLTGLRNRRAFDEDLQELVRERCPFFYASFDVNGLKRINDEKGHATGDELLRRAASFLNEQSSEFFKAYRVGGDEFAFLASLSPITDHKQAQAEQILDALKKKQEQFEEKDGICPYFAVGYGCLETYSEDQEVAEMMAQVDREMYREKGRGKLSIVRERDAW